MVMRCRREMMGAREASWAQLRSTCLGGNLRGHVNVGLAKPRPVPAQGVPGPGAEKAQFDRRPQDVPRTPASDSHWPSTPAGRHSREKCW
jgi:hypothetical protein